MNRLKKWKGFTWYPMDWIVDEKVFRLKLDDRAVYRELIDLAMMNDNRVLYEPDIWCRRWNANEEEIKKIVQRLIHFNLIELHDIEGVEGLKNVFVPSCEKRLDVINKARSGGIAKSIKSSGSAKVPAKVSAKVSAKVPAITYNNITDNNITDNNKSTSDKVSVKSLSDLLPPAKEKPIDYKRLLDNYHKICVGLPKVRTLTQNRKRIVSARVKLHGREMTMEMFKKVAESDFLNGKNDRGWVANFDFIFKENNFVRILEGYFDNKEIKNKSSAADRFKFLTSQKVK